MDPIKTPHTPRKPIAKALPIPTPYVLGSKRRGKKEVKKVKTLTAKEQGVELRTNEPGGPDMSSNIAARKDG